MSAASYISRQGPSLNIRNMAIFSKPHIEIALEGSEKNSEAFTNSFSTMDPIQGVAKIVARHDTKFDNLEIALLGESALSSSFHPEYRSQAFWYRHPADGADS